MDKCEPKKDWKVLERHYKKLSEVWQYAYEDETRVIRSISILNGIIVEMYSDLIAFEKKFGKTDNSKKSQDRLILFGENIDLLMKIQGNNYGLKLHNKRLMKENYELRVKLGLQNKMDKQAEELENLPDFIDLRKGDGL